MKPVPNDFMVFAEPKREVSDLQRQQLFNIFDSTIDQFLVTDANIKDSIQQTQDNLAK